MPLAFRLGASLSILALSLSLAAYCLCGGIVRNHTGRMFLVGAHCVASDVP